MPGDTTRIVYITDVHLKAGVVGRRKDDFRQSILKKLEEIVEICNRANADYLLIGGDFYDSPSPSPAIVKDVLNVFSKLNSTKIYAILGNHEMVGHRWESVNDRIIGLLQTFEQDYPIRLVGNDLTEPCLELAPGIPLYAAHYRHGIEQFLRERFGKRPENGAAPGVFMVHANILKNQPVFSDYILMQELHPPVKIVLCSHYHPCQGVLQNQNGCIFVSPGALARTSATIEDLRRSPSGAFLEISRSGECKARIFGLKSALPAEEIFDLGSISDEKEDSERMREFIELLESYKGTGDYAKIDIVAEIHALSDLDPKVKEKAIEFLSRQQY